MILDKASLGDPETPPWHRVMQPFRIVFPNVIIGWPLTKRFRLQNGARIRISSTCSLMAGWDSRNHPNSWTTCNTSRGSHLPLSVPWFCTTYPFLYLLVGDFPGEIDQMSVKEGKFRTWEEIPNKDLLSHPEVKKLIDSPRIKKKFLLIERKLYFSQSITVTTLTREKPACTRQN